MQQKEAEAEQECRRKEALLARAASQLDQVRRKIWKCFVGASRRHASVLQ